MFYGNHNFDTYTIYMLIKITDQNDTLVVLKVDCHSSPIEVMLPEATAALLQLNSCFSKTQPKAG